MAPSNGHSNPIDTALVLLNLQQGYRMYHDGAPMVPSLNQVATNVAALLASFRQRSPRHIIHMREDQPDSESFLHPGHAGHQFEPWALPTPGELVLPKTSLDGFLVTDLHTALRTRRCSNVLLVGYTTDQDVNATALGAQMRGYTAIVVPDATATWGDQDDGFTATQAWHDALTAYQANGILLKSTGVVLEELSDQ